jgi:hypothetical protein
LSNTRLAASDLVCAAMLGLSWGDGPRNAGTRNGDLAGIGEQEPGGSKTELPGARIKNSLRPGFRPCPGFRPLAVSVPRGIPCTGFDPLYHPLRVAVGASIFTTQPKEQKSPARQVSPQARSAHGLPSSELHLLESVQIRGRAQRRSQAFRQPRRGQSRHRSE